MTARRRVCVVTGTRAEYGLLGWLMKQIASDPDLQLQVVVTGMHLSAEFGLTYRQIEADGFTIDAKVEMLLSSDSAVGIAKAIGLGVIGFADVLDRLKPDIVVVLGDRFEVLAAAQAAMVVPIVLAHIGGGDYGEATYDNLIRHAVTKMAHLHFVTHAAAANRVRQLGEDPATVFDVGSLAVDSVRNMQHVPRETLENDLNTRLPERFVLVTYHPTTIDLVDPVTEFREILKALEMLIRDGISAVFTMPNCDNNSRRIRSLIEDFHRKFPESPAFESLGQRRYLNVMRLSSLVLGNSSSGIYEAPLLSVPTLDIGNRQRGRARGRSVRWVPGSANEIYSAAKAAMFAELAFDDYPYGHKYPVAAEIARLLREAPLAGLTYKKFFDYK